MSSPPPGDDPRTGQLAALLGRVTDDQPLTREDLAPILGGRERALTDQDLLALQGQLAALELGPPAALRLLDNEVMLAAVGKLRAALAARLFDCVARGAPLPDEVRHAFGVASPWHEEALAEAVRRGGFTFEAALVAAYNNRALARLLAGCTAAVPLRFRTTLGVRTSAPPTKADGVGFDTPWPVRTDLAAFTLMVSGPEELWRATTFQTKEPETVRWLGETIGPDSVFYDVGANVGLYTLYAARLHTGVRAVCFEPDPLNFARLNMNLRANGLKSALAFPVALSDATGLGRFGTDHFANGASTVIGITGAGATPEHEAGCALYRLDDFLAAAPFLPSPTLLKVDVDGPEREVLRGAAATLARPGLRHLLVELFEGDVGETVDLLAGHEFEPVGHRLHTQAAGPRGRVGNWWFRKAP
jgi:FkbM family methyltransferase